MIITVEKPIEEVLGSLTPYHKVFVVGCGSCAAKCQTGGEDAVKAAVARLEAAGKTVTGWKVLDSACDIRLAKKDIAKSAEAGAAEAIVMLACGAGVQAVGSVIDTPSIPTLNPVFVGTTERIGVYKQFCAICGDCLLAKTEGICPVSRCAKGLVNGPCGGVVDGKCEVDGSRDCAWALIFARRTKRGKSMDELAVPVAPRTVSRPKEVNKTRTTHEQGMK